MSYAHQDSNDVENDIIGIKWDTSNSSSALTHVDVFGHEITQRSHVWFDSNPIWGGMTRCTILPDGTTAFGSNARGDGLVMDGSAGQVMVRVPRCYVKAEKDGNYLYMWFSPYPYPGFDLHPAFMQRGGMERSSIYVGAYAGCLGVDSGGTEYLISKSGEQPWTGGDIAKIPFGAGVTEIAVGDIITGETSGNSGTVVAVYLASGTWVGGDAAGYLYIKYPGTSWTVWTNPENIQVSSVTRAVTTGVGSSLSLTRSRAEGYGNAYGSVRWGICNIWTWDLLYWLYVAEYCDFNSQSTSVGIGSGVTSKPSGTGFAGEENGADASDTNIDVNGSGTGTGTNGYTPVVWRGIENPWGNIWQFVIGIDITDGGYRVLNRDGSGVPACPMGAGSYESSSTAPITSDGYISGLVFEDLLKFLAIPGATSGSSSSYSCDYLYGHDPGETNVLFVGGSWSSGTFAGFECRRASNFASASHRDIGVRPEYI